MSIELTFDTETTGMVLWKEPSDKPEQPHLVQLAAVLFDTESKKIIQSIDLIIKPNGWEIPADMTEIYGITQEFAMEVGVDEKQAIKMLLAMLKEYKRVAFNTTFDNRIIRIALKRYAFPETTQENWKNGEYECAMIGARKIMGGKNPKLEDAYKYFTGNELVGAHSAMVDTLACMEVYFAVKEQAEPETDVQF